MRTLVRLAALALPLAVGAQLPAPAPADLVVTNARIYTVDASKPTAAAMAVRDGRIVFVGDARGAMALRGAGTRVVDVRGARSSRGWSTRTGICWASASRCATSTSPERRRTTR